MNKDINERTTRVKESLGLFDSVGIASRERLEESDIHRNLDNMMEGYESVIVFAKKNSGDSMGEFDDYLSAVSAQAQVIDYINKIGYRVEVIEGNHRSVSLVKLGIEAGVGELSPVDSLVVKGSGLNTTLGAMITDAPLVESEKKEGICIGCMRCIKVCPIREGANEKGDLKKCGCGKCIGTCPA